MEQCRGVVSRLREEVAELGKQSTMAQLQKEKLTLSYSQLKDMEEEQQKKTTEQAALMGQIKKQQLGENEQLIELEREKARLENENNLLRERLG